MTTYPTASDDERRIDGPHAAQRTGRASVLSGPTGRQAAGHRILGQPRLRRQTAGTRRPTSTHLFRLAAIVVVAAVAASLIGLIIYAPTGGAGSSLSGPAVAAGALGMFTAVGGGILGFSAAVRSANAQ
jgi:hypothetical protein